MKRYLVLAITACVGLAVTGCSSERTSNTPQPQRSREEIYEQVSKKCEEKRDGLFTYGVEQCEIKETMAIAKPEPKPISEATWSPQYQAWYCPTSAYDKTSYECTKSNLLTKKQFEYNTLVDACTGRANKTEDSPGWYWAERLCKKDTNAF